MTVQDVCRLYLNLGHTKLVHQLVEDAQKEASQVKEVWMMLAIRGCGVAGIEAGGGSLAKIWRQRLHSCCEHISIPWCTCAADVIEGSTSKSLSGYKALLATYDRLGLDSNTLEAAKTLLEYGSLLDRYGLASIGASLAA